MTVIPFERDESWDDPDEPRGQPIHRLTPEQRELDAAIYKQMGVVRSLKEKTSGFGKLMNLFNQDRLHFELSQEESRLRRMEASEKALADKLAAERKKNDMTYQGRRL